MSADEFREYRELAVEHLAREEAEAFQQELQKTRRSAEQAFDSLLPGDGPVGPGQHLHTLWEGENNIGYAWISLRGADKKSAYVLDFYIYPKARGKGYGAEAFRAIENRARELGAETISLNVFCHNGIALRLYEKLGFRTVSYLMTKAV